MELTERNLACYIAMNNGISDGIKKEDLELYFDLPDKDLVRVLGKIKRGKLYPTQKVWYHAIRQIIHQNKALNQSILEKENCSLSDCIENNIGSFTFKTYLSKRQLKKIIDENIFAIKKKKDNVCINYTGVKSVINNINVKCSNLEELLSAISLEAADIIRYVKIKKKENAELLIQNNFVTKEKRNIYKLTENAIRFIFFERLKNLESSFKSDVTQKLNNEQIVIINTLLDKNDASSMIDSLGLTILKQEQKIDMYNTDYNQFIISK